jgi:hypothetical protein
MIGQPLPLLIVDLAEPCAEIEDCRIDLSESYDLGKELLLELGELLVALGDLTPLPQVVPRRPKRVMPQRPLDQQVVVKAVVVKEGSEAIAKVPGRERQKVHVAALP